MNLVIRWFVWTVIWLTGCFLFDGVLELSSSWLMLGGALTYMVCDSVDESLKRAEEPVKGWRA